MDRLRALDHHRNNQQHGMLRDFILVLLYTLLHSFIIVRIFVLLILFTYFILMEVVAHVVFVVYVSPSLFLKGSKHRSI